MVVNKSVWIVKDQKGNTIKTSPTQQLAEMGEYVLARLMAIQAIIVYR